MSAKAQNFQRTCRARLEVSRCPPRSSLKSPASLKPSHPRFSTLKPQSSTRNHRFYATQSTPPNSPSRRAITVTSDDGRYNWSELSRGEKAARTTQQSFNFLLVVAVAGATGLVAYYLYTDLFASSSYTVQFNHAVDRIRSSSECRELLGGGSSKKIKAYGEPTSNKWARARPLAHSLETDRFGTMHFRMRFNVEGEDGTRGVANVYMTKREGDDRLEYKSLRVRVDGKGAVDLESDKNDSAVDKIKSGKMFGIQWR